jgi:hypothetical protein
MKKGAKPKFRAPTGDTTKERQPLQQSTDRLVFGEGTNTKTDPEVHHLSGSFG